MDVSDNVWLMHSSGPTQIDGRYLLPLVFILGVVATWLVIFFLVAKWEFFFQFTIRPRSLQLQLQIAIFMSS